MAKVLVIDDERISLALVKFGLKAEDYEVTTARDGREGLKELKAQKFDCIVLDIMMPNVNGYEFMAEVEKMLGAQIPPVLILTAKEKLEDVFKMKAIKGYFVKPVHMSSLVNAIQSCLNTS